MAIIYFLVARNNKTVLCEFTELTGNFEQISLTLLAKNNFEIENHTEEFGEFKYFWINEKKITFLCIASKDSYEDFEKKIYEILFNIRNEFFKLYSDNEILHAAPYSIKDFIKVLKEQMRQFNKKSTLKSSNSTINTQIVDGIIYKFKFYLDNHERRLSLIMSDQNLSFNSTTFVKKKKRINKKFVLIITLIVICIITVVK